MRRGLSVLFILLGVVVAVAQTPVITSVTPIATYPSNSLLITGSGFGTPAQLQVTFDGVVGNITASTNFSIEVTLPPYARLNNINVLNKVSGLSGKSEDKAVPTFGGATFDETQVSAPLSFAATPVADEPFDVCSCDLDGDGKPDLAGSKQGAAANIMLLRNTSTIGSMSFVASTTPTPVAAPTFNITCGDLDGDGKWDVIASRGAAPRNEIFVLRNTSPGIGTIAFAASTTLLMTTGDFAFRLTIRDLNADGKPDIVATNAFDDIASTDNLIYVFVNQSTPGTISFAAPIKLTVTGSNTTYGLDVQDLDGDDKPDIIVNPFAAANIYVLRNTSAGAVSFAPSQQFALAGSTLIELTTADFNEDGKLDIATTSAFDNRLIVLLNQSTVGAISFAAPMNITTDASPWGVAASDVDGDGDADVVVGTRGAGNTGMNVFVSNGVNNALAFTKVIIGAGKKARNLRVGDLDGDAKPDFAFTTDVGGKTMDIIRNANCYVPTILNPSPFSICPTQTVRLNAAPGFGVTIYDWKESGVSVSSGTNPFYDVTVAGNYTVTATSEGGACVTTSNIVVINSAAGTIPADPVISSNSPLCSGTGQTLTLFGPTVAGVTYIWNGPNGFISANEDPTIPNVNTTHAGNYTLQLSNGACFSNVVSTRVDVANISSFSVGSSVAGNTICQGSNLTLTVTSQPGYTYQWIKDGADIGGQTAANLVVTVEAAYTCRVTNTALACSITTSPAVNVTVLTQPVAAFTVNPTACVNEVLTFTDGSAKDARGTAVYAWAFGDGGVASTASPTYAYTTVNTFNPSLTLNYSGVTGCSSNVSNNVVVSSSPTVTITPPSANIKSGESVQLLAAGASSYTWLPPDGLSNAAIENPVASPTVTTTYTVTGIEAGCPGTATIIVDVIPIGPSTLDIPNVFTPNGDGMNDLWILPSADGQCTISVYDPSGRKVFEDHPPATWDGLYNGTPSPQGTYFYVIGCPVGGSASGHFLLAR